MADGFSVKWKLLLLPLLLSVRALAAPLYSVTDLGTLDSPLNESYPTHINDVGQITGHSYFNSADHAFLWTNGTMTNLPGLGSRFTVAAWINNAGVVVGESDHAFRVMGSTVTDLGT